jgi:capsular polysaccharide biosynthesis protein
LDSLAALGISTDRLKYQADRGDTVIERLWFATPVGHSTFSAGELLRQVARGLKKGMGLEHLSGERRIYISRRRAAVRRVINEFEIEPLLNSYGFEILLMEELPFKKQVEACATASALVGPHGGGLTNLMFCAQKSKIGEIAVDGVFPHYLGMAQQSGHLFHRLMVSKAGPQDMVVDVAIFEQWLRLHFNEA